MEERRPERRGEEHSLLNPMFTSKPLSWLLKPRVVKYIKSCFHCHLPSLERGQGTNGLEIPLSVFGPLSKCHLAWEENGVAEWGRDSQCTSKHWCQILHPPSPLPHLGGRSLGSAGISRGRGTGRWVAAACGAPPPSPYTAPPRTREKKNLQAKEEGKCC